jgi:hypothetical protein
MLEEHYRVKVLVHKTGWKHGEHKPTGREVPVIVTVKDPYAWLVSIFKYSNFRGSFNTFVTSPYSFEKQTASNPLQHWNRINQHWLDIDLEGQPVIPIRYEDLLENPKVEVARVAKILKAPKLSKQFFIPHRRIRPGGDETPNDQLIGKTGFIKTFYTERVYMNMFDESLIKFVAQEADYALVEQLGYTIIGLNDGTLDWMETSAESIGFVRYIDEKFLKHLGIFKLVGDIYRERKERRK